MEEMRDTLSGQAGLLCELLTAAMEPKLAEAGISLGMFELLSAIQGSGGRGTQIEVAKRLGITPPSLSETVKSAVGRGFVEQHIDSDDGRRKILKLTQAGRKAMQTIVKGVNTAEAQIVDRIDPAQIVSVVELLRKVNRN